jgi:hypothetical protein
MSDRGEVVDSNKIVGLIAKAFDPNEDRPVDGAILPSPSAGGAAVSAALSSYVEMADRVLNSDAAPGTFLQRVVDDYQKAITNSWEGLQKARASARKAIDVPGSFLSFARMTYMPDTTDSNILPWPGVDPEALKKIVMENLAPNLIIGMRVDDVMMYSLPAVHIWRPGWRLEVAQGDKIPTPTDKKEMLAAESFLQNSSTEIKEGETLKRDEENLTDFQHFLAAIVRDTLTYDFIALSTDRDAGGRVVRYGPVPAGNIRLVGTQGYDGNKDVFAVAVDEGGTVKKAFTRQELVLYVRNPRTDPEYSLTMTRGYGTPEIQTALKLIQIFQNVIEFNSDIFQKSGVPHGLLLLTGNGWTQKQVDVLTRMWLNLKRGISKALALPVLAAPKEGKVEVVDFSRIKGDEAFYQDLLNLSIGCFCAVYRFPSARLGYRISGRGPDAKRSDADTPGKLIDDEDVGKVALLIHIETLINQNLIVPRWPNLRFRFTGKEPKADAREYEARRNALTWGEARAEADLPNLLEHAVLKDNPGLKELMQVMSLAPIDPNLSGVYQSAVAAWLKGEAREGEELGFGNNMTSTKDPARAESHGKVSGVRRDSAAESGKITH